MVFDNIVVDCRYDEIIWLVKTLSAQTTKAEPKYQFLPNVFVILCCCIVLVNERSLILSHLFKKNPERKRNIWCQKSDK